MKKFDPFNLHINKNMRLQDIHTSDELIRNLKKLDTKTYVFRGQDDSEYFLIPSAFRKKDIETRLKEFSECCPYEQWFLSEETKKIVLQTTLKKEYVHDLHVRRIYELTIYIMQYNYYLARHIEGNEEKFDSDTLNTYKKRPRQFWTEGSTFQGLFRQGLHFSTGQMALNGNILKESYISEEMTIFDESLPQHYGTKTANLDCTRNFYIAIHFALRNISENVSHFSVFAIKQLKNSEQNLIVIKDGNPACKNSRIERQEGRFICLPDACRYYFFNGRWPAIEDFSKQNHELFEIIKYRVPISEVTNLRIILEQNGITEEYLLLNTTEETTC